MGDSKETFADFLPKPARRWLTVGSVLGACDMLLTNPEAAILLDDDPWTLPPMTLVKRAVAQHFETRSGSDEAFGYRRLLYSVRP
jgi:hypothetical protein